MNQHEKMDDRASESFAFGGLMFKNKLRCKNRNFNCRQTKIMLDVDQSQFKKISTLLKIIHILMI